MKILVPRRPDDHLCQELTAAGFSVTATPLTRTVPLPTPQIQTALTELSQGYYRWFGLTSARTLAVLAQLQTQLQTQPSLPEILAAARKTGTKFAAVGPASARALRDLAGPVDLIGAGSAARLLELWGNSIPNPRGSADSGATGGSEIARDGKLAATELLPGSARSQPTLAEGLTQLGWNVTQLPVYTTESLTGLDPALVTSWQRGDFAAALITAGSNADALGQLLGPPPEGTVLVALGEPSATAARATGLTVAAIAPQPDVSGILQALAKAHITSQRNGNHV